LVYERVTNFLYSGDLIYTGAMYLHLNDSDYNSFKNSIKHLVQIQNENTKLVIWPSHNQIPLPDEYPQKVLDFTHQYDSGTQINISSYASDDIFLEGLVLENDGVKIIIKKH